MEVEFIENIERAVNRFQCPLLPQHMLSLLALSENPISKKLPQQIAQYC